MSRTIRIGRREVGQGCPCMVVAEAGANHDGDFMKAKQLVAAAAAIGADAIKFQHYTAHKLASREAKRYWLTSDDEYGFQFDPNSYRDSQLDTFNKIDGLPREHDKELIALANKAELECFSTPFDFESVDHLAALGAPAFKIASGDLTYHDLVRYIALQGRPVILSTGASYLEEIDAAVNVIRRTGNDQIVLLHCTLAYPTPLAHANLLMMHNLARNFPDCLIGLSDHTPGNAADVAAAMLGAVMIEKHFTATPGPTGGLAGGAKVGESPDHDIGLGPADFHELVLRIRDVDASKLSTRYGRGILEIVKFIEHGRMRSVLGRADKYVDSEVEFKARLQARRSLVAAREMLPGEVITKEMLAVKRPGTGIPPYEVEAIVGQRAAIKIEEDAVIKREYLAR